MFSVLFKTIFLVTLVLLSVCVLNLDKSKIFPFGKEFILRCLDSLPKDDILEKFKVKAFSDNKLSFAVKTFFVDRKGKCPA